jgi:hypothetical protein
LRRLKRNPLVAGGCEKGAFQMNGWRKKWERGRPRPRSEQRCKAEAQSNEKRQLASRRATAGPAARVGAPALPVLRHTFI